MSSWREARLTGLLRHRHLVDIYDVGNIAGVDFCALELCDGALDGRPPLPPRAVIEVGLQVCEALAYAQHEMGLVHLDLKPGNLLVRRGEVKITDLGIAFALGFGGRVGIQGTPRYMSPEQRAGAPVDTRSDIYSLGCTLRDLAIGDQQVHRLGGGDFLASPTFDDFWSDGDLETPRPAESDEGCPDWLLEIFERCVQPDPEHRFGSMEALAAALRALDVDGSGLAAALALPEPSPEPPPHRSCLGREVELAELEVLLSRPGLVTLHGVGGVGKSHLAASAAWRWSGERITCDLAEQAQLVYSVARGLGAPLTAGAEPAALVGRALATRPGLLLILDNIEPQVEEVSTLEAWCAAAPELRVLVTSRTILGVAGEQVMRVPPLAPDAAVELLADVALERGVEVDRLELAELAARLDHLPLALVLAAGRMGVLTAAEICARATPAFLRSGEDGRRSTMQIVLDESWESLTEEERSLLGELTLFRGGFDAQAVSAVSSSKDTAGLLQGLRRRSLLSTRSGRMRLSSLVRAHAAARSELGADSERRHGLYYAQLGAPESLARRGDRDEEFLSRHVRRERANLDVAVERAVARGDAEVAVGALAASNFAAVLDGPLTPALERIERLMAALTLSPRQRCRCLLMIAELARILQQLDRAREAAEEALQLAEDLGAPRLLEQARYALGDVQLWSYDLDNAYEAYTSLLEDPSTLLGRRGLTFYRLGILEVSRGRPQASADHLEEALKIFRRLGNRRCEGNALSSLSNTQHVLGQHRLSIATRDEAIARFREVADPLEENFALSNQAVALLSFDRQAARETYAAAYANAQRLGLDRQAACIELNMGNFLREEGELDRGAELFAKANAYFEENGELRWGAAARWFLGTTHCERGELDEALAMAASVESAGVKIGDVTTQGRAALLRGQVALARGESAVADLQRAAELFGEGQVAEWGSTQYLLAEGLWAEGSEAAAFECIDRAIRALEETEQRYVLAEALCARAQMRSRCGAAGADEDLSNARALVEALAPGPSSGIRRALSATAALLAD